MPFVGDCSATCGIGLYLDASSGNCTLCPTGYFKSTISDSADACLLCAVGTQSSSTRDRCVICPAGYACDDPRNATVACSSGTWAAAGDGVCSPCPPGFYCASTTIPPLPCAIGRYSSGGNTSCASCPIGQSCQDPAAAPVACGDGYYSPLVRALSLGFGCGAVLVTARRRVRAHRDGRHCQPFPSLRSCRGMHAAGRSRVSRVPRGLIVRSASSSADGVCLHRVQVRQMFAR